MSSQKGNASRSRGQKHQNTTAFKNDKYGATIQVKKAKSKIHDGLCQHCKGVLEWKVKYNKYKPLTQPRKWYHEDPEKQSLSDVRVVGRSSMLGEMVSANSSTTVRCSQKTVKDAYHMICKPCSLQLEICCKCGKKEEIVIPVNSNLDKKEQNEDGEQKKTRGGRGKDIDDLDSDDDYDDEGDVEDEDDEDFDSDTVPKKTQNKSDALPDVSRLEVKE